MSGRAAPLASAESPPAPPFTGRFLLLALGGALATAIVVVAGGEVGPVHGTVPLSSWMGLLDGSAVDARRSPLPGLSLFAGVVSLVVIWLLTWRTRGSMAWPRRRLWTLAGCWSLPLVVGPPLLSSDVFSYAAQGFVSLRGYSPYSVGPSALGVSPVVAAVDPVWRNARSPYGPLATAIERAAAVLGHSPLGAVVLLRVLAVVSVVASGWLVLMLAGPHARTGAFLLTVVNPVTLLHVVSAAHLEGVMCALVLGALVAFRRGRPHLGLVLGCAAGLVKAPALVVVVVIGALVWHNATTGRFTVVTAKIVGTVAASLVGLTALVPDGWAWLTTLATPGRGYTPAAPAALFAAVLTPAFVWTGCTSFAVLDTVCRSIAMVVALAMLIHLVFTVRRRPPALTTGIALLAMALLAPVLYPWYLLWGIVCLAAAAPSHTHRWLVMVSAVASTMAIQGLATSTRAALAVTTVSTAIAWVVWSTRAARHRNRGFPAAPQRATSLRPALEAG